jgi:hypothetical protein
VLNKFHNSLTIVQNPGIFILRKLLYVVKIKIMKDYALLAMDLYKIKKQIIITSYHSYKNKIDGNEFATFKVHLRKDLEILKAELFNNVQLSENDLKELKKINQKIALKFIALKRELDKIRENNSNFA